MMIEKNEIRLHGRNLDGLPYLFSPSSDEGVFSEIYIDLVRCNDLAFVILNSGEALRENEKVYLDTAKPVSNKDSLNYRGSIFDGNLKKLSKDEEIEYSKSDYINQQKEFVDNLYSVREFEMLYSKSLVLAMIQFTFESSLKKLILALDPKEPLSHFSKDIVYSLMDKIDEKIGNQAVLNEIIKKTEFNDFDFKQAYKPIGDIRNKFVHGNWEQLKKDINDVNPTNLLHNISKLLMRYQEAINQLNLLKPT